MIFATMGTQLPFDRFLKMLDQVAPQLGGEEIVAQVIADSYRPVNFAPRGFIAPAEFASLVEQARVVVAHAGMGTIITALDARKPIVVVPRQASLGEHRNEHQLATANRLGALGYVYVAHDADELAMLLTSGTLAPLRPISSHASDSLVGAVLDSCVK
ncbi:MAG: glycosyl transferase family 28 [Muribaculaceae bacterium]|nr:glycosyl transferase family 28 [Muribaculaceae bacterium]